MTQRPSIVSCVCCGQPKRPGREARELLFVWSRHIGGSLGSVRTTATNIWACNTCEPWEGNFPKSLNPVDRLLSFIRSYLVETVSGKGQPGLF